MPEQDVDFDRRVAQDIALHTASNNGLNVALAPMVSSGRPSRLGAPDPAAVMAAHYVMQQSVSPWNQSDALCSPCSNAEPIRWPCEPYRLAEALAAEQAKVARVEAECSRMERTYPHLDEVGHEVARWFRAALADQPEQVQP